VHCRTQIFFSSQSGIAENLGISESPPGDIGSFSQTPHQNIWPRANQAGTVVALPALGLSASRTATVSIPTEASIGHEIQIQGPECLF
jgi:hypothetical protein